MLGYEGPPKSVLPQEDYQLYRLDIYPNRSTYDKVDPAAPSEKTLLSTICRSVLAVKVPIVLRTFMK